MQAHSDDGPAPAPARQTILVVDDTPANVGMLVVCLEQCGFDVVVAQDGAEGLQRAQCARPDLILLDVMMPGMDGFETCRRLKELGAAGEGAAGDIPVIFMTALTDTESKLKGFKAGGVDYVTKPVQIEEVLARIRTHLTLRAMRLRLREQNLALQRQCAQLEQANRKLAEARARALQAERMASIGSLAAGVAHEINNPLGFISSNLATLGEYGAGLLAVLAAYEAADPLLGAAAPALMAAIADARESAGLDYVKADLATLIAESGAGLARVKRIVDDLREFSHVGETRWQVADLRQGLDSALNIMAHELRGRATVVKAYGAIPEVACMPLELNQVFLNLLRNAVLAIGPRGEIRVGAGVAGDEVWVEIADNGCGIAGDDLARIFDPFFTTWPVGRGAGLGLSLSYATVRRHGGHIDVRSSPGQGSAFRVRLPLRRSADAAARADEAAADD